MSTKYVESESWVWLNNLNLKLRSSNTAKLRSKHKKTGQYQLAIPIVGGYRPSSRWPPPLCHPCMCRCRMYAMLCLRSLQCRSDIVTNSLHLRPLDNFIHSFTQSTYIIFRKCFTINMLNTPLIIIYVYISCKLLYFFYFEIILYPELYPKELLVGPYCSS